MLNPRALLIVLFLIILAPLLVALFVKKSKPIQDAQSYAMLNPTCREFKIHSKKNDMVECLLNFESLSDLPANPRDADTLYIPMARFIGEKYSEEFPLRVSHIFSLPDKIMDSIRISGKSINVTRGKNSVWRNEMNGCKFPGPCPVMPLKGTASEAPVNAILPGKILKIERDSLFSVTIYHGDNIYSKTSGLNSLSDYVQVGSTVSPDSALGFLPASTPRDTAFTFVEITRNGKYEAWDKFYSESRGN